MRSTNGRRADAEHWITTTSSLSVVALALAMVAGCGGKAVVDGSGAEGGAAADGGPTTTFTTSSSSSSSSSASTSTTTFTGQPDLRVSLDNLMVGIGCMPEIPPDPVYASFEITYDNSTGTAPVDAALIDPSITFPADTFPLLWRFAVEPASSGLVPAGGVVTVRHEKVAGSGSGEGLGAPCNYCGAAGAYFEVDVDVGPSLVTLTESFGPVGCAY